MTVSPGFERVEEVFRAQLASGEEIGAAFAVYHRGRCVVDLWGGLADRASGQPWVRDTRVVVFSITKGFAAMALALLADRGRFAWDAPVADYWPGFARGGKAEITVRQLFNHAAGLPVLDVPFTLAEVCDPAHDARLVDALERQVPAWEPGKDQGYHGITFGMYAKVFFTRIAGESMGTFLSREWFEPLGADASLGRPASVARLYPPSFLQRVAGIAGAPRGNEARIARGLLAPSSLARRVFANPWAGGLEAYAAPAVVAAELPWASATASAQGIARAYLPLSLDGEVEGRRFLSRGAIAPLHARQSWVERDRVLQKPLGWSQGFLKDETHLFSPTRAAFGHPGIGGSLGWCDPENQLAIGYAMNRLDWRVRSPRALALCRAVYAAIGGDASVPLAGIECSPGGHS